MGLYRISSTTANLTAALACVESIEKGLQNNVHQKGIEAAQVAIAELTRRKESFVKLINVCKSDNSKIPDENIAKFDAHRHTYAVDLKKVKKIKCQLEKESNVKEFVKLERILKKYSYFKENKNIEAITQAFSNANVNEEKILEETNKRWSELKHCIVQIKSRLKPTDNKISEIILRFFSSVESKENPDDQIITRIKTTLGWLQALKTDKRKTKNLLSEIDKISNDHGKMLECITKILNSDKAKNNSSKEFANATIRETKAKIDKLKDREKVAHETVRVNTKSIEVLVNLKKNLIRQKKSEKTAALSSMHQDFKSAKRKLDELEKKIQLLEEKLPEFEREEISKSSRKIAILELQDKIQAFKLVRDELIFSEPTALNQIKSFQEEIDNNCEKLHKLMPSSVKKYMANLHHLKIEQEQLKETILTHAPLNDIHSQLVNFVNSNQTSYAINLIQKQIELCEQVVANNNFRVSRLKNKIEFVEKNLAKTYTLEPFFEKWKNAKPLTFDPELFSVGDCKKIIQEIGQEISNSYEVVSLFASQKTPPNMSPMRGRGIPKAKTALEVLST